MDTEPEEDEMSDDLGAVARSILDAVMYMVLGTADEDGRPWVSPVWFAPANYRELYWVSDPEALHSRNIAARPDVSMVVFDSHAPMGTGQAVYMRGTAERVEPGGLEEGMRIFSERSLSRGGREWTVVDVSAPAILRLYRATATNHWILDPNNPRDKRTEVSP